MHVPMSALQRLAEHAAHQIDGSWAIEMETDIDADIAHILGCYRGKAEGIEYVISELMGPSGVATFRHLVHGALQEIAREAYENAVDHGIEEDCIWQPQADGTMKHIWSGA